MPATTYSFHRAADHEVIETATPSDLQSKAANLAANIHKGLPDHQQRTTRIYVHNGTGIVAAGLCKQDLWHDVLRENYYEFDDKARAARTDAGLPNDPKPAA